MSVNLSAYSYLTLEEVKEWLNILPTESKFDNKLKRIINTACSRVESYLNAPVLDREYVEYLDGNNSNVIMLTYWPITSIKEIKIDFNRHFDDVTALEEYNFVLRGIPPMSQNATITIEGSDVVLRDDSNVAVLGRIFAGSTIQSIKVTYTAGRGATPDLLPDDLKNATLMFAEYLYMVMSNRELGIGSKGVFGQSYSKKDLDESGMPKEVVAMLDDYKDWALPTISQPQRNTFKV